MYSTVVNSEVFSLSPPTSIPIAQPLVSAPYPPFTSTITNLFQLSVPILFLFVRLFICIDEAL